MPYSNGDTMRGKPLTRYMDHDYGDGTAGRDDRVLYEDEDGNLYDDDYRLLDPTTMTPTPTAEVSDART